MNSNIASMNEQELDAFVYSRVKEGIQRLLHPDMEIVSLDNPVPAYAHPEDAGADIRASLNRLNTTYWKNTDILTNIDELELALEEAYRFNDREKVEQICAELDEVKKQDPYPVCVVMHPGGHCVLLTGIFTAFPKDYEVQIRPRSGLALKARITITNSPGTIDSGYRNEYGIILDNEGASDFIIRQGDRIGQMVCTIVCHPNFIVKNSVDKLTGPDRGGGFGSTKIK